MATDTRQIDMSAYGLFNNGVSQQRQPNANDTYVVVDRFANSLPAELYTEEFLRHLRERDPVRVDLHAEQTQRQYINYSGFVDKCLKSWFPQV